MSTHLKPKLNVTFLPYMAPGHMMPMVEIARLFASHGATKCTIITTPANASRFNNTMMSSTTNNNNNNNNNNSLGCEITFLTLTLPTKEVGLPDGCENLVSTPTPETTFKLFRAIEMLQPKLEEMLLDTKPDCIVSDVLYPWTVEICSKLKIPRLGFSGSCFFNSCVSHCLERYRPHDGITLEDEEFVVPRLNDKIVLTRSQLQDIVKGETKFNALFERLKEAETKSFGVLMNTFYELESNYANFYRNDMGIKAWCVGPLWKFSNRCFDDGTRHSCLDWLDSKQPKSVVYICFGSLTRFNKPQLVEIASALEELGCNFIWVLPRLMRSKDSEEVVGDELEEEWWVPNEFEEKIRGNGKGVLIRGWAPQVQILGHTGIGGFLTHCGWNSILEGVTVGVPLITWPIFADQFYNEKLVTQVLKVGVEVGNKVWKAWATEESTLIVKDKIKMAISKVMSGDFEAKDIRLRTQCLSEMAHNAIKEGGSSYNDIKRLMEEIKQHRQHTLLA